jgi:zinc protease
MKGIIWMICLGLIPLGVTILDKQTAEGAAAGLRVKKFTLGNGLTVVLQENHTSPVVAFNVWVRAGSGDETDPESGLAHVLEHMVFKGTQRRKVGQIAQEVESAGGDINAFTSFDQTVYHVVLASRFFENGLDIIADAIRNSAFNPEELKKELEVVIEEVRRGEDIPYRRVSQALFKQAFRVHPYRRPVIGTTERLRTFDRTMVVDFFQKWYVPENMVLVVTGNFETEKAMSRIRAAFEDWPSCPVPPRPRTAEPPQQEMRVEILEDNVQEAHLNVAFHIPPLSHEDVYALDVLGLIAGQGESSRLYRRVKDKMGVVHSVSSSAYTPKDPGLLVAGAVLEAKNVEKAVGAILKELYALKYKPPSEAELEKAKLNIEADFVFRKETAQGQAQSLGYFETVAGDVEFDKLYVERIRALKIEDIQEAAQKYLRNDNLTIAVLLPKDKAGLTDEDAIRRAAQSAEGQAPSAAGPPQDGALGVVSGNVPAEAQVDVEVHREILPNGMTLLVKENPSVPTVAIRAVYLGGIRFEEEKQSGISNFIADLLTRGTENYTAAQFATLVDSMAANISGFSGRNSLGVTADALTRHFDSLLDLFGEVLLRPAFDPDEIEKTRKDILADIKREEDKLSQFAFKLFLRTLYGKHPYSRPVNGLVKTVKTFQRKDLLDYYRSLTTPDNLVLAVVGDLRTEYVVRRVKEVFGESPGKKFSLPAPSSVKLPETPLSEVKNREKNQAHIVFGFLGTTLRNKDRYPLEVLNSVLSGQGGRLFVELRDKKSLAYTVSSFNSEGLEPGTFGVYIATAPEKVETALNGIREELEKARSTPVTPEELERAQKYLIGGYEIDLQRNSAQAADMAFNERYGLGWDEFKHYPNRIAAVTAEDVLRVARKYIRLKAPVLGMVIPAGNGQPASIGVKPPNAP